MPSDIVILDAAGTPVTHTFVPNGYAPDQTFWWVDASASNALGYWKIGCLLTRPPAAQAGQSSEGRNYRVKVSLLEPVLANVTNSTVSGVQPAPVLAYSVRAYGEFVLPEAGAILDRKNIAQMFPLVLQDAQIKGVIENLTVPGL